jgi:predicted transcriptional regulator
MVRLMKEPQQEAVVVDGDGHPIGLLAKAVGEGARPEVTAHACMEPAVVTVLHGATVERAREVQATSGVRTIPVVLAGRVVGRVGD